MTILFANFAMYLIWLLYALKKREWRFDIFCLVLIFYVLISFFGFFTCATGIYQNTFGNKNFENLSVFPYLFSLLCTAIFMIPLRMGRIARTIPDITPYSSFFSKLSFFLLFIFIMQAIFSIMNANVSNIDYAEIYSDAAAGAASSFQNPIMSFLHSKTMMLARLGMPFFYIIQFLFLVKNKNMKHVLMIFIAYLLLLIPQILSANRGGMFFSTANIFFFIVLFWSDLSHKSKRFFLICLLSALSVMSSFAVVISNARFEQMKNSDGTEQIFRYFGEPYPNLGFNIWDKNINHPYGSRMFPDYSAFFTGENLSKNYKGGRNAGFYYWERFVGIPMLNFKTLFGDLYIEFGFFGVWCIAAIWIILLRMLKKGRGFIGSVVLSFFAYQTCIWGLFGSNLSEQYITTIVYAVVLLWLWKKTNFGKIRTEDKLRLI